MFHFSQASNGCDFIPVLEFGVGVGSNLCKIRFMLVMELSIHDYDISYNYGITTFEIEKKIIVSA